MRTVEVEDCEDRDGDVHEAGDEDVPDALDTQDVSRPPAFVHLLAVPAPDRVQRAMDSSLTTSSEANATPANVRYAAKPRSRPRQCEHNVAVDGHGADTRNPVLQSPCDHAVRAREHFEDLTVRGRGAQVHMESTKGGHLQEQKHGEGDVPREKVQPLDEAERTPARDELPLNVQVVHKRSPASHRRSAFGVEVAKEEEGGWS